MARTKTPMRQIAVPLLLPPSHHYVQRHIDVQLDQDQAETLAGITLALNCQSVRLKGGRHVERPADALRWLLEQVQAKKNPEDPGSDGLDTIPATALKSADVKPGRD